MKSELIELLYRLLPRCDCGKKIICPAKRDFKIVGDGVPSVPSKSLLECGKVTRQIELAKEI